MNEQKEKRQRRLVRVEAPNCACGYVGHMPADEPAEKLLERICSNRKLKK